MRIAYVCSDRGIALDGHKGAAVHVREMARAFAELGHEVVIFTFRPGAAPADLPARAVALEPDAADRALARMVADDPTLDEALRWSLRSLIGASGFRHELRTALQAWSPDLIYERHALHGTAGATLARELQVPHVLEVNAPLADEQERHRALGLPGLTRELERRTVQAADLLLAVSSTVSEWLVTQGVSSARILTLPNAVDPRRFRAQPEARASVRSELGLGDGPMIAFSGSLRPWHDLASVVRAMTCDPLAQLHPRLLVVGDGPSRDDVAALASRLGIADSCRFVGAVPYAAVPSYLAAADVAVAPYAATGGLYFSPLKVFESMAAGLPVVSADGGDIRCCIVPGRTGYLYEAGDDRSLAWALGAALEERDTGRVGAAARAHVLAHHTWQRNAMRVLDALASAGDPARSASLAGVVS